MRFTIAVIIERLSQYNDYATAWTTRMWDSLPSRGKILLFYTGQQTLFSVYKEII